jgi:hypothetical protein
MNRLNLDLLVEQVQSVEAPRSVEAAAGTSSSVNLALRDLTSHVQQGDALETQIPLIWH